MFIAPLILFHFSDCAKLLTECMTCCSLYKAVSICSLRWKKIQKLNAGVSWNLQRITASLVCAFFFDLQLTYFRTSDMFCLLSLGYHRSLCVVWFLSSFLFLLFKYYIFTDTKKDIRGQKIFLCIYLPRDCLLGYLLLPFFFFKLFKSHSCLNAEDLEIPWEDHLK